ncbi:Elongator subunit [Saccharomycopsis crataegensis]|uniref:Elongator complex protein 4 n=1 Tax=Saccharomycopsis crataegensis TaxID=43959 RepID=A0AAV5QE62_9ASCO|nr:Elongator subunit [Saccharomycopsis crataegensis]
MSFQRKNKVLGRPGGASGPAPNRIVPGRTPNLPGRIPNVGLVPGRSPNPLLSNSRAISNRRPVGGTVAPSHPQTTTTTTTATTESETIEDHTSQQNPSIKPSIITSQPTISTGTSDIDKLILHGGLPVGTSLLLEETGSTDYSSILLKFFAAQGIVHNRIEDPNLKNTTNCHVIVIGGGNVASWVKELPGVYKGSRKELKKKKIRENESKLSVQNIINNQEPANPTTTNSVNPNLKIAWRYGLSNSKNSDASADAKDFMNLTYPYYNNTFDITTRLIPGPRPQEITFLPVPFPGSPNKPEKSQMIALYKQIESVVKNQLETRDQQGKSVNNKIIRIILPNLLNPSTYHPSYFQTSEILPFLQSLKSLVMKYSNNLTLISSISTDLFSLNLDHGSSTIGSSASMMKTSLVKLLESQFHSILQLDPFNEQLLKLLEASYKNQPTKIQQGFINVAKIYNVSDKGMMCIKMNEYAFRNGRRNFEVGEWSIPVEEEDDGKKNKSEGNQTSKKNEEIFGTSKSTTKNIDF